MAQDSSVTFTGDGSTTAFDIPFPFLARAHVRASVSGVPTEFTWSNPARIEFASPPPTGASVLISRETPTTPLYTIPDNQPVPSTWYNQLLKQALYVAEENRPANFVDIADQAARVEAAAELAEALAEIIQAFGGTYPSRTALLAANVPAPVARVSVLGVGQYERDAATADPAATSNGGTVKWVPALGGPVTPQHFGAVADGVDTLDATLTDASKGYRARLRYAHQTGTAYTVDDLVWATVGGVHRGYRCIVSHTSTVFTADLAAGRWVEGAFTGTENSTQFQAAIDYCMSSGRTLEVPAGKYRIGKLPVGASNVSELSLKRVKGRGIRIEGEGLDVSVLLMDENVTDYQPIKDFIRTTPLSTQAVVPPEKKDTFDFVELVGFSVRGRWSHAPIADAETSQDRMHCLALRGAARVLLDGFGLSDIPGKGFRSRFATECLVQGCSFERISSNPLQLYDYEHCRIIGNHWDGCDDDAFDASDVGNYPSRANVVAMGNTFRDVEGVVVIGPRNLTFIGNTFDRPKGGALALGGTANTTAIGETTPSNIVVSGNTFLNHIGRYDVTTNALIDPAGQQGTIMMISLPATAVDPAVKPGRYNAASGAIVDPRGSGGTNIWYQHGYKMTDHTMMGGGNMVVSDNAIRHSLLPAAYANWGFGWMFTSRGWKNPTVAASSFCRRGISFVSDLWGAVAANNVIEGYRTGSAYFFHQANLSDTADAFRNIRIIGGTVRDCFRGVDTSLSPGSTSYFPNWGISIESVDFNLDPYHKNDRRQVAPVSGAWLETTDVTAQCAAVAARNVSGWIIRGCRIANCYVPFVTNTTPHDNITAHGNVIESQPIAENVWNAANRGVAICQPGGMCYPELIHHIVNCQPSHADYGKMITQPRLSATAMITTGTYVAGHVVECNMSGVKTVSRWKRLTTGTGHVMGTDWAAF